jgi:hypothetical protein
VRVDRRAQADDVLEVDVRGEGPDATLDVGAGQQPCDHRGRAEADRSGRMERIADHDARQVDGNVPAVRGGDPADRRERGRPGGRGLGHVERTTRARVAGGSGERSRGRQAGEAEKTDVSDRVQSRERLPDRGSTLPAEPDDPRAPPAVGEEQPYAVKQLVPRLRPAEHVLVVDEARHEHRLVRRPLRGTPDQPGGARSYAVDPRWSAHFCVFPPAAQYLPR